MSSESLCLFFGVPGVNELRFSWSLLFIFVVRVVSMFFSIFSLNSAYFVWESTETFVNSLRGSREGEDAWNGSGMDGKLFFFSAKLRGFCVCWKSGRFENGRERLTGGFGRLDLAAERFARFRKGLNSCFICSGIWRLEMGLRSGNL